MHFQSQSNFQQFLLNVDEDKNGLKVEIPLGMVAYGNSLDGVIETIFDDLVDFSECVILAVQNNHYKRKGCFKCDFKVENAY